jgi:hypothetical protein
LLRTRLRVRVLVTEETTLYCKRGETAQNSTGGHLVTYTCIHVHMTLEARAPRTDKDLTLLVNAAMLLVNAAMWRKYIQRCAITSTGV